MVWPALSQSWPLHLQGREEGVDDGDDKLALTKCLHVPSVCLNTSYRLTHVIFVTVSEAGTIIMPILQTGKWRHRELE